MTSTFGLKRRLVIFHVLSRRALDVLLLRLAPMCQVVTTVSDVEGLVAFAAARRASGCTDMNLHSSRSHLVVTAEVRISQGAAAGAPTPSTWTPRPLQTARLSRPSVSHSLPFPLLLYLALHAPFPTPWPGLVAVFGDGRGDAWQVAPRRPRRL